MRSAFKEIDQIRSFFNFMAHFHFIHILFNFLQKRHTKNIKLHSTQNLVTRNKSQ